MASYRKTQTHFEYVEEHLSQVEIHPGMLHHAI